jgi:hypothetical protein
VEAIVDEDGFVLPLHSDDEDSARRKGGMAGISPDAPMIPADKEKALRELLYYRRKLRSQLEDEDDADMWAAGLLQELTPTDLDLSYEKEVEDLRREDEYAPGEDPFDSEYWAPLGYRVTCSGRVLPSLLLLCHLFTCSV